MLLKVAIVWSTTFDSWFMWCANNIGQYPGGHQMQVDMIENIVAKKNLSMRKERERLEIKL